MNEELQALKLAIASGVKKVVTQTGGTRKEVEYPSFDDMRRRLEWLEGQQENGAAPRTRVILGGL